MAEAERDTSLKSRKSGFMDKSWLKGTHLYFVEYVLFLVVLTVVLWLFDALVFHIFAFIADAGNNPLTRSAGVSTIAASLVGVPALYLLWRRIRGEQSHRPGIELRKAFRLPLYVFVFLQAISILLVSYVIVSGIVSSVVDGFDGFGRALLVSVLPGLFALAAHKLAVVALLDLRKGLEKTFIAALSLGLLVTSLILMLTLAVNRNSGPELQEVSPFDSHQDSPWNRYQNDRFRSDDRFFDY